MPDSPLKVCNACGRVYEKLENFFTNTSRWRMCQNGHLWFNCSCDSTNMLLKGKFDWYSPERFMTQESRSLFNTIPKIKELPQLPTYVMELQQLIQQEQTTAKQLAEMSKKAPVLASKILEIANRKAGPKASRIESLEHAIAYLGISILQDIIMVASLQSITIQTQVFKIDDFWEDAFATGRVAEALAIRFAPHLSPDKAYIAGTLCNIGKLVLALYSPNDADLITKEIHDVKILGTWQEAEKRHSIPSHTALGEIGGSFWGIPEYVLDAIMLHHQIPQVVTKKTRISLEGVVSLANQMSHWLQLKPSEIDQKVFQGWLKIFQLDNQSAEEFIAKMLELKVA
ncbi:MAG: HDOD domain-containing protein [Oligoflexus sp.]